MEIEHPSFFLYQQGRAFMKTQINTHKQMMFRAVKLSFRTTLRKKTRTICCPKEAKDSLMPKFINVQNV